MTKHLKFHHQDLNKIINQNNHIVFTCLFDLSHTRKVLSSAQETKWVSLRKNKMCLMPDVCPEKTSGATKTKMIIMENISKKYFTHWLLVYVGRIFGLTSRCCLLPTGRNLWKNRRFSQCGCVGRNVVLLRKLRPKLCLQWG